MVIDYNTPELSPRQKCHPEPKGVWPRWWKDRLVDLACCYMTVGSKLFGLQP